MLHLYTIAIINYLFNRRHSKFIIAKVISLHSISNLFKFGHLSDLHNMKIYSIFDQNYNDISIIYYIYYCILAL